MNSKEDILVSLKKIEELLNILVKNQLGEVLKQELSEPKKKKLYELTGKYDIKELSKRLDRSTGWISGVWKNWNLLGLIIKDGKKHRKIM